MVQRRLVTHIKLYKAGEPVNKFESPDYDDWFSQDWSLGVWNYSETTQCWGLRYFDSPTHMCYIWPDSNPKAIVIRNEKRAEQNPNPDYFRWYFDVGAKLYVEFEDLIPACKELGIWDV